MRLKVPRVVYIRQGDPGTEDFISSMIENPAQGKLVAFEVHVEARNNSWYSASDKTEWLGAAGLGLPGFNSFVRKESAEVLKEGGL
jgi:hypothetical protein